MPRSLQYVFGACIVALLVGGPLLYNALWESHVRNFRMVRDGVLYRSGQMPTDGLQRVIHDYNIKTVVTLRDAHHRGNPPPDLFEEVYCKDHGINYCRIPPRAWLSVDGAPPGKDGIEQFLKVMDDPANYPVLVHCWAGIHRTGAFCAIYRMEYEHWANDDALAEMRALGYSNIEDEFDVMSILEQYQPRWQTPAPEAPATASQKPPLKAVKYRKHPKTAQIPSHPRTDLR